MIDAVDIQENEIASIDISILDTLLIDRTMSYHKKNISNILWLTKNYEELGPGYFERDEIRSESITGSHVNIIQPRVKKTKDAQKGRSREKAEVFTPAWVCNKQNNLIDEQWFGKSGVFNVETSNSWKTTKTKILFSKKSGKTWRDYVKEQRIEITCGEAPYLTSSYDTLTGEPIPICNRIGILDRKLRVISENVNDKDDWFKWAVEAFKSIYAFEWQGDNLVLARENLFYAFVHNFVYKFNSDPTIDMMKEISEIISWNVWQMDGLKGVIPGSCHEEIFESADLLFYDPNQAVKTAPCPGCVNNDLRLHNGYKCLIMDWELCKPVEFISLVDSKLCRR